MALVGRHPSKRSKNSDNNRMNIESARLDSFRSNQWQRFTLVFIHRLANAGFFSTGFQDEVECFSCKIRILKWKESDTPKGRHKHASPNCRFVSGKDVRNIADVNYVLSDPSQSNVLRTRLPPNAGYSDPKNGSDVKDGRPACDQPQECRKADYRFESVRLSTFKRWLLSLPVDPYELADAGFYVVDKTTVQCFACFVRLSCSNWRVGDRPMRTHKKMSPSCPFVLGKNTGNRPMTTEDRREALKGDIHQKITAETTIKPRYPQFVSRESRLLTFTTWEYSKIVDPVSLAEAGFFYSNYKDKVRCFCCGCGLEEWLPGDVPQDEHARFSPNCQWLSKISKEKAKSNVPYFG